jgi:hypothetical protein
LSAFDSALLIELRGAFAAMPSRSSRKVLLAAVLLAGCDCYRNSGQEAAFVQVTSRAHFQSVRSTEARARGWQSTGGELLAQPSAETSSGSVPFGKLGCAALEGAPVPQIMCWEPTVVEENVNVIRSTRATVEEVKVFTSSQDMATKLDMEAGTELGTTGLQVDMFGQIDLTSGFVFSDTVENVWKRGHQLRRATLTVPVRELVLKNRSLLFPESFLEMLKGRAIGASEPSPRESLAFAREYGTHMITGVLLGGVIEFWEEMNSAEVLESDSGNIGSSASASANILGNFGGPGVSAGYNGAISNLFRKSNASVNFWRRLIVRGGKSSLVGWVDDGDNGTAGMTQSLYDWRSDLERDDDDQWILEVTTSPMFEILPSDLVKEREWLEKVVKHVADAINYVRQRYLMVRALAESLNGNWDRSAYVSSLEVEHKFTKASQDLCKLLDDVGGKLSASHLSLPKSHNKLAKMCDDARVRSWTKVFPYIAADTSHDYEEVSLSMGILDNIRSLSSAFNSSDYTGSELDAATCGVVQRAFFCQCVNGWSPITECEPVFEYKGKAYQGCTLAGSKTGKPWCSHERYYGDTWSYCLPCSEGNSGGWDSKCYPRECRAVVQDGQLSCNCENPREREYDNRCDGSRPCQACGATLTGEHGQDSRVVQKTEKALVLGQAKWACHAQDGSNGVCQCSKSISM